MGVDVKKLLEVAERPSTIDSSDIPDKANGIMLKVKTTSVNRFIKCGQVVTYLCFDNLPKLQFKPCIFPDSQVLVYEENVQIGENMGSNDDQYLLKMLMSLFCFYWWMVSRP